MRFLIIDDDSSKRALIIAELAKAGVRPADVQEASCVVAARVCLGQSSYDVMLLDVLIPIRDGDSPAGRNSIELLREIIEDGTSAAPRYVIGITADLNAVEEHRFEFQKLMTNVILIRPGEEEWKSFLKSALSFIRRVDGQRSAFDVDVCVLSALKNPELENVLSTWPLEVEAEELLDSNVICRPGKCDFGTGSKRVVCAYPSQMGPISATHAATSLLRNFKPRLMIMTGICGGFKDEANIGDIVVADRSWDWQSGKWADGGTLLAAPDHREPSNELVAHARTIPAATLAEIEKKFHGPKPATRSRVVVGPMVTGSSVVASADIQKAFRNQHRKMVGIDMECYAVYYATAMSDGPATKTICIKGVSDLADREKSDNFQNYCSHMSAGVGFEVAARYFSTSN